MKKGILSCLLLAALGSSVQAQVYKCPTPTGGIELTDKPCAEGQRVKVRDNTIDSSEGRRQDRLGLAERAQAKERQEAEFASRARSVEAAALEDERRAAESLQSACDGAVEAFWRANGGSSSNPASLTSPQFQRVKRACPTSVWAGITQKVEADHRDDLKARQPSGAAPCPVVGNTAFCR